MELLILFSSHSKPLSQYVNANGRANSKESCRCILCSLNVITFKAFIIVYEFTFYARPNRTYLLYCLDFLENSAPI